MQEDSRQVRLKSALPEQGITFCKSEEFCADEAVLSPDLHSSPQQPVTREINNWLLSPVQSNPEKKSWSKRLAEEI